MLIENAYATTEVIPPSENIPKPEPISSGWTTLIPMVLVFAVIYFLLIRPQEKRRRQQEELIQGVKKGEEVVTNSGIFGIISKINDSDNTVELEVAKDTYIKILKSSIMNITSRNKTETPKTDIQNKAKRGKSGAKTS